MVAKKPEDQPEAGTSEVEPEPELVHPATTALPTYDQETGAFH